MRVDPKDGRCRSCDGVLEITDSDDATMSVECTECGDEYQVEPDAFGDGAQDYYVEMHCQQITAASPPPTSLGEWVARLKVADVVPRPPGEDAEDLIARIAYAEPGRVYAIDEETYFHYLEILPPRYQSGSHFCFGEGSGTFTLFWRDANRRGHFARPLSEEETDTFCRLAGVSRHT